jgi:spore coat protein U-like protein
MGSLTTFGNRIARFLIRPQFHQLFFWQILLIASIVPLKHVLAGSASTPLAIMVTVIRSCHVSTLPAVVGRETKITETTVVTFACSNGFDPAIVVNSGSYATGTLTHRIPTKRLANGVVVDSQGNRSDTLPLPSRDQRVISLSEPHSDGEDDSQGRYRDTVTVTVNF